MAYNYLILFDKWRRGRTRYLHQELPQNQYLDRPVQGGIVPRYSILRKVSPRRSPWQNVASDVWMCEEAMSAVRSASQRHHGFEIESGFELQAGSVWASHGRKPKVGIPHQVARWSTTLTQSSTISSRRKATNSARSRLL